MASINGTNVAAPVRPFDDNDTFATAFADEIKGGLHSVDLLADLYDIPEQRREVGMVVTVRSDNSMHMLINEPGTDKTTASDWDDAVNVNTDNIKLKDGVTSLTTKLKELDNTADNKWIVIVAHNADKAGPNNVEIRVPFKSKVVSISASAPADAILSTDGVDVEVEYYDAGSKVWTSVGHVELTDTSVANSATFQLAANIELPTGTKVRAKIAKAQKEIKLLEVNVALAVIK